MSAGKRKAGRLVSLDPSCVYVTHYGRLEGVRRLADMLLSQLDAMVAIARRLRDAADRHEALKEGLLALYRDRLHAHGCRLPDERIDELLALDVELNAQGIEVWLDRPASP